MHLNQLAFYCSTISQALHIKSVFGLQHADWIIDTVTMNVRLPPDNAEHHAVAELQFNESLGMQFEILRMLEGPCWLDEYTHASNFVPLLSHIGLHLGADEGWPDMLSNAKLIYAATTIKHTHENFHTVGHPQYRRQYAYRIYEITPGIFVKYIKRLNGAQHG